MALCAGGKYRMSSKLGSGSFGDVYVGTNARTGKKVAIKVESMRSRHQYLSHEVELYKMLGGFVGAPNVHWHGVEGDSNVMVLDLLGPSLEELFNSCSRKFSLKTVLMLADQMLTHLEYVHTKSVLHRDIKPDNFCVGLGDKAKQVHIIDFGLAKKYRDARTQKHMCFRQNLGLTGTVRYCSINTHRGCEPSRRDDLEALGYVLMYFLRGKLPWQGLKGSSTQERNQKIMEKKISTCPEDLCKGFPTEFATYLDYCRNLNFEDEPDYAYLRLLLKGVFLKNSYKHDFVFDWTRLDSQPCHGSAANESVEEGD